MKDIKGIAKGFFLGEVVTAGTIIVIVFAFIISGYLFFTLVPTVLLLAVMAFPNLSVSAGTIILWLSFGLSCILTLAATTIAALYSQRWLSGRMNKFRQR